ncbi:hypothetical protein ACGFZ7_17515 [Pseudomonas sp. NPDC047963]
MKKTFAACLLCVVSVTANAAWPVLSKGEVICDNWSDAMDQAHYFMQGIDEIVNNNTCGRVKSDTEYVAIGAQFIRDANGVAVKSISIIRIRKNKIQAFHVPKDGQK